MSRYRAAWLPLVLVALLLALGLPRNGDAASARQVGRVRPGEVLVELRAGASADAVARRAGSSRAAHVRRSVHRLAVQPGQEHARAEALKRDPDVVAASPNYLRSAQEITPNDPLYAQQWWLPQIAAPSAWSTTIGSPSIKVAVLDSGVDLTHPDLQPNLLPGVNTVGGASAQDDYGHGTHVAGIVAAASNNANGVAGVAWDVRIQPVKVLDSAGNGDDAQIIAGIDWAIQNDSKVINLSLGGPGNNPLLDDAVARARQAGLVVVAAAGNAGGSEPYYPGASPGALAVAGTTQSDTRWPGSNYGSYVGIAAPADSIYSTTVGNTYGYKTGTSMSTPMVAGAAALVWSHHPSFAGAEVVAALLVSADKVGVAAYDARGRNDQLGHGRLNALRALQTFSVRLPLIPQRSGVTS